MERQDAGTLAHKGIALGLVTKAQVMEYWETGGDPKSHPSPMLRFLERKGYITPWQSHKLIKGDDDGFFLGGYRVLYRIASGSFGRVFRADDPRTGTVVAIKVLRRRWSEDPHSIELFEREGQVGLSLRHPNIVSILAVSRDPVTQQYFIVMDFVEGGNLRDFLAIRKKLEPAEALRLLEDTAQGLSYAYRKGVTHRDIKLTNILISSQGTAKLVDFGLAGIYHHQGHDQEGEVDRTVDYAGLEKATGVKWGDVRSDIYFLGCVLYEMLTGRSPLPAAKDRRARMLRQRFDNVLPMRNDEVNAPPGVFRLVETMMALNPRIRFQTPSQLLGAIRQARRELDEPAKTTAEAPPPPQERSVFVVEQDPRLQDLLRRKLKGLGFRVFLAVDPEAALIRFRQQPYDALVVDATPSGDETVSLFQRIITEAGKRRRFCAGILVLGKDQEPLANKVTPRPEVAILYQPLTFRQLSHKLNELLPQPSAATPP